MIRIENLVKTFGAKRAVDGISFGVERGEVLGFSGRTARASRRRCA
jgi:ABC-2 type transport system ATP-binding protein